MKNLVLDLRNNPGGLLGSAIEILEMIIPKGEKLLTTKGRNKDSNREFFSRKNPLLDEDIQLAVLINQGSASASEIVAGVIQDLDRGIVIGKRSFGKGLVQSIFGIDQKRSLKITTAKYYIPSGRLIQKPNYLNEDIIIETGTTDSLFTTKSGRSVKGGGGIYPDFPLEIKSMGPLTRECWRKGYFFSFARENKSSYSSMDDVLNDPKLMSLFSNYIHTKGLEIKLDGEIQFEESMEKLNKYDESDEILSTSFDKIESYIKEQKASLFDKEIKEIHKGVYSNFAQMLDGNKGRIRYLILEDDYIHKAQELLHDHMAYSETVLNLSDN